MGKNHRRASMDRSRQNHIKAMALVTELQRAAADIDQALRTETPQDMADSRPETTDQENHSDG